MNAKFYRYSLVVAVLFLALGVSSSQAGLLGKFKELLQNTDTAMTNYNKNMWGEGGLGDTLIQGVKGKKKWHEIFDSVHVAQKNVQDQALTDVKAVLKTLSDIVLWLPRKLQELFKKLMDKIAAFIKKLEDMNQGATVKDRWNNLVNAGGGGGGGDGEAASMDAGARASNQEELPDIEGAFSGMLQMAAEIDDEEQGVESFRKIRSTFLFALEKALEKGHREAAVALMKESPEFYSVDPEGMHSAVEDVATRTGGEVAKDYVKVSARLAKAAQLQQQQR